MFKPELYKRSNSDTRQYVQHYLEKYCKKLKWVEGEKIIDLGCGDGSVTVEVLKRHLPERYGTLMGCDISEVMVRHANENYADNRTSFFVLDMGGELPFAWKGGFNHAFSFYALHWVPEQMKAFQNVYDLLANNGECLLVFVKSQTTYDIYRALAKSATWCEILHDSERFIPPYHDALEPEKQVKQMMVDAGFRNVDVKVTSDTYRYEENEFRDLIKAICPFKIPGRRLEDFVTDFMREAADLNIVRKNGCGVSVYMNHSLIIAYGTK